MGRFITTITKKGQVTIPAEIRVSLGLGPRDKVLFELEGAAVKIMPARSLLMTGYGAVKPVSAPEDFKGVREEIKQAIAEEVDAEA